MKIVTLKILVPDLIDAEQIALHCRRSVGNWQSSNGDLSIGAYATQNDIKILDSKTEVADAL